MSNSWKIEEIFVVYENAKEFKKQLLRSPEGATLQVKIRRYSSNKTVNTETFVVKSRTDPSLIAAIQEVEERLLINKSKSKKK
jgi:hypothetical protein